MNRIRIIKPHGFRHSEAGDTQPRLLEQDAEYNVTDSTPVGKGEVSQRCAEVALDNGWAESLGESDGGRPSPDSSEKEEGEDTEESLSSSPQAPPPAKKKPSRKRSKAKRSGS